MKSIPRLHRFLLLVAVFFFIVMFLMRILAWWSFHPPGYGLSSMGRAFWLGFRYDARDVSILCLLLLLFGAIPALNPYRSDAGRKLSLSLIFAALLLSVVFYVFDFLHFRYLLQRLNASALNFLADARISGSMVWQTYPVVRILIGMVIAMIVLFWCVKKIYSAAGKAAWDGSRPARLTSGLLVFFLCALGIFGRIGQYPLRWSDAFDLGSDFQANLALNPFQSFFSSLSFRSFSYDKEKVKQAYPEMAAYLGVQHPDVNTLNFERNITARAYDTLKVKPNIVLVICESFSGYKSSMWGNPLNTTPYFNELCKQGLFFDNCFTPAYGTARGVWATITGIPDVELQKTASRNPAMVDQHTIINDFDGYEKFYFLGGSTSWANIRGLLTNNIHNLHLYEQENFKSPRVDVWGISDRNLFLEAAGILGEQKEPFFAVIQTADNHRPYTIPQEDRAVFKMEHYPADTLKKYGFESNEELNAFRYTDFAYRSFIEAAARQRFFDNTIFMFIGDHGIDGSAGDMFPRSWTDNGLTSYHVPLLFYAPKLIKPQRLHCVASQLDVLPTLAGLANISYRNTTLGRDLVQCWQQDSCKDNHAFIIDPNVKDIGVIAGPWYYTSNQQGKQEKMLWADFSRPGDTSGKDSLLAGYRRYTSGFYETAKYMLMNNKKK